MAPPLKQSFELYVDDDRYGAPTLHLIFAWNPAAALEIAAAELAACAHHRGAEICQGGRKLAALGSLAIRRLPSAMDFARDASAG